MSEKNEVQIILLSGGSGKRLWPLSNDARSKQFLKLLASPDGTSESMVQRVVRQIRNSGLSGKITFATNASQKDVIVNQLGEDIEMVLEPCRRDTFPAIALAVSHLHFNACCSDDQVVVVMPCDQFTETGYFETVGKMAGAVEEGLSDLVLMGISPTCPSSKFGYVIPEPEDKGLEMMRVKRFTEKPDERTAGLLLKEGALWNGGVFAFRLGYMMDIVRKYVDAGSFEETLVRYSELPKISFDYEVAEKASSVLSFVYQGKWKDLGTWNSLSEELPSNGIGNVTFGESNRNTHVVNELGIPVFCAGMADTVVACGPDGILVCAKNESEKIKTYVDSFATRPMYEERRWGVYRVVDNVEFEDGFRSLTKNLTVKAGRSISYQLHHHRDEVWTFIEGEGIVVIDGEARNVGRGDVVHVKKGQLHAVKAVTDLTFIEVQTGDMLVEDDIDRFDLDWKKIV